MSGLFGWSLLILSVCLWYRWYDERYRQRIQRGEIHAPQKTRPAHRTGAPPL